MNKRAEQLQREYLQRIQGDNKKPEKILPDKEYGEAIIYIYRLRLKYLFLKKPSVQAFPDTVIDLEMINQIRYGKNTFIFCK